MSIGFAAAAVALAIGCLVVGGRSVSPHNLVAVKQWYLGQHRLGTVVGASGLLLVVSLALAAVGSSRVMATSDAGQPTLIVSATKNDEGWDLSSEAKMAGLNPDDHISLILSGVGSSGGPADLAGQFVRAGAQGEASASLKVEKLTGYREFKLLLRAPDVTCTSIIDPTTLSGTPENSQLTCSK